MQPLLGYAQSRRFEQAIERAMTSCDASGNQATHHLAGAGKPIVSELTLDERQAIGLLGGKTKP